MSAGNGLRAAVFDLDGLLIDSEPLWRAAEMEVFGALGVPLTESLCRETTGLRIDETVAYWQRRFPWEGPGPQQVAEGVVGRLLVLIRQRGEARPGVAHALSWCREHGLGLALASSSERLIIHAALARLGLEDTFAEVHSGEDEPHGKPHPGIYLTVARRLGLAPRQCLAIEDSLNGVLAAKSARMPCIAVPDPYPGHPGFAIADAVIPSLNALGDDTWARVAG
jgi:HAD superfamily hydrolase (TIGR01509 family)